MGMEIGLNYLSEMCLLTPPWSIAKSKDLRHLQNSNPVIRCQISPGLAQPVNLAASTTEEDAKSFHESSQKLVDLFSFRRPNLKKYILNFMGVKFFYYGLQVFH